jgi:thiamine monophosphate kinase
VVETTPSTLVTTDSLVEGAHFLRDAAPPRLLGPEGAEP